MTNWETLRLGDVLTLKRGYDLPKQDRVEGAVPIYSSSGLSGYHNEAKLDGPGVVTGRYGTLGEVFYIEEDYWPHNTTLYVKDFKGNHSKFIYYFLGTLGLNDKNDKTSVPGLNRNHLHDLKVSVPKDIEIQRRIAEILTALDDKIELNRRMNQTLEQMAQTLFKDYFVDGIDEDNLPEGWRRGKLREALELPYGKALKAGDRKGGRYPVVGSSGIVGYHETFISKEKGIMVGRKGNAGSVFWLHERFYPIDTTYYVQDLLNVENLYFHYFLLKSLPLKNMNSDSAVPGLNRNDAYDLDIFLPASDVIKDFNKLVEPLFDCKYKNEKEISTLTKTRDTLLPKLMSGEIDVMQAQKDYEPILS